MQMDTFRLCDYLFPLSLCSYLQCAVSCYSYFSSLLYLNPIFTEFKKFVIFADQRNKEIYQLSLDSYPAFQVTLPLQNLSQPIALDLDPYQSHIYWTDISTHSISRAALNGSFQEVIIKHNTPTPAGLAVDPIGRNIYWTDEQTNQIEVAKLDGSYRRVLFYDEIDHPRDVVLDTDNG